MVYSGLLKWPEMESKSIRDVKIFVGETSSDPPVTSQQCSDLGLKISTILPPGVGNTDISYQIKIYLFDHRKQKHKYMTYNTSSIDIIRSGERRFT